jgi:[ribosomal protein S18]-alanine N-acetyltransferase
MIRSAGEQDLPILFDIYLRAFAAARQPSGSVWNRAQFHQEWDVGRVWVGQDESSQIHSFIFARHNGQAWEITQLATDPKFWRRGHMEFLLQKVIDELAPPIWLEVHESNAPACRLYEKLGFTQVGSRPRYYLDGGAALLYSKT